MKTHEQILSEQLHAVNKELGALQEAVRSAIRPFIEFAKKLSPAECAHASNVIVHRYNMALEVRDFQALEELARRIA